MSNTHCIKRAGALISLLMLAGGIPLAHGYTQSITAVFKPDSAKPNDNKFQNTTPLSGYCASYPGQCAWYGMFSIRLPIEFVANQPIQANHADVRQGAMFKVPAQWRTLAVTNELGEEEVVEIRVAGVGSRYRVDRPVAELVGGGVSPLQGHQMLWYGSSWVNTPAPCAYSGVGAYGADSYLFLWRTPVEGACAKQARFDIPYLKFEGLDFAYELRTPNPLGMSIGKYTGSLAYSIGPGMDFDMGDVMMPNDTLLNLEFSLDVQHMLKVEIPPGGNNIELVPHGGWQSWVQQGRRPTRLFRDQTFNIWSSGRFKMQLECQYPSGNTCAIQSENGEAVPLTIGVSLPNGIGNQSGQQVSRVPLLLDGSTTRLFAPTHYVDRRPGTLHFEIPASEMEPVFRPGAPSKYSGNVVVIWDSEV